MLTLYTAIGTLKFVKNTNEKSTPMVLNNHQEFGLCDHELILWSCLASRFCRYTNWNLLTMCGLKTAADRTD